MIPFTSHIETFPAGEFLIGKGANHTSQFGCDGLIEASLERFGIANRWCFEVGAYDGDFLSNTHRLRNDGWNTVLIESDPELFERLKVYESESVHCVHETIDGKSLDRILNYCGAPKDLDLGVIDIDGQDYWAWDGMRDFEPRLMLVEFDYMSEGKPDWYPTAGGKGQATYQAISRLGISKGYVPLAKTTVNLLFVKRELL